jgi:beta-glucosidase
MTANFPNDFLWGAATSAFQIEGAARQGGKGPSIWDDFCATPGNTARGDTGEIACDHYHRYQEDLALLQRLNLNAYRFSISWPRVLPQGRGPANEAGWDFYERLVDGLLAAGIQPLATLYHWDLPATLQTELDGWANPDLPHLFADYAEMAFNRLGDRVRYWLTLNEPWCVAQDGYIRGYHAPGIKDRALGYRVGHNLLRAHAYAVARYRAGRHNHGAISYALNTAYSFPATDSPADAAAAERSILNFGGWFGDPPYYGDYPAELRIRLGPLLPAFTPEDSKLLRRSIDFIALNYYASDVVRHAPGVGPMDAEPVPQPTRALTTMGWPIVPEGLHRLLHWLNARYPGLPIHVTENGVALNDQADESGFVDDQGRIAYLREHLAATHAALKEGVDVRGYFVWSLLDNLEWSHGFEQLFGLVRCDRRTLRRTIKASGKWYARFIAAALAGNAAAMLDPATRQLVP